MEYNSDASILFTSNTSTPEKKVQYLSTYKEAGLFAKKQWILPDWFVRILKWLSPLIFIALIVPIILTISRMKRAYFLPKIIGIFILAIFFADLTSAIAHVTFVDNAYSSDIFRTDENDYMIVPVLYGYSSCHHYFPSNWKNVDDTTSWLTMSFFVLFFVYFVIMVIDNLELRLLILLTYFIIPVITISHKYMHERHHKRPVPIWVDCIYYMGGFITEEKHIKHHENDVYDWGLLNGSSDFFLNFIIKSYCQWKNVCPIELMSENYSQYEKKYQTDVVKMRFIGDIEGRIKCKRDGHRLLLLEGNH